MLMGFIPFPYLPIGGALYPAVQQKSIWNSYGAELGIDGNMSSCATTGYDIKPWYWIDMGASHLVKSVTVAGKTRDR